MKTVAVGEIQNNFSRILKEAKAGREIAVTKEGKPVAKITALGPTKEIDWPDFYGEAIELEGKPAGDIVIEGRKEISMDRSQSQVLTREALQSRINELDRVPIAHLPTPLEFCPRLSEALGGPRIWMKRDDCTGLALGGNKTRQLEFIFAEARQQGADTIVVGAASQSNWCRQTAAAASKFGMQAVLILKHGIKGAAVQGNLLLDYLLGADVTIVPGEDLQQLPPLLEERMDRLKRQGRKPYLMNPFGLPTLSLAAISYVNAFLELDDQLQQQGLEADYIYLAGANITPAGLALGAKALGRKTKVIGITPIRWDEDRCTDIARIANATAERLGLDVSFHPDEIYNEDAYVGERYGVMTPECHEALKLAARTEGIILDPVYTAKAMAGLIDHIRRKRIKENETVVFLHTGGTPALFAYAKDLETSAGQALQEAVT